MGILSTLGTAAGTAVAGPAGRLAGGKIAGLFENKEGGSGISGSDAAIGGMGIAKTIMGKAQQKKADAMLPANEDPEVRRLQREFQRRKRSFQTGTAQASQRQALKEQAKQGMQAAFKFQGGARGLNMMSRMFNQGIQGLATQGLQGETTYAGLEQGVVNRMADRKLQLGMQRHDIAQARAAQTLKEGKSAGGLALARTLGVGPADSSVLTGATPPTKKKTVAGSLEDKSE